MNGGLQLLAQNAWNVGGWTMLHFLWVGVVVGLVAAIGHHFMRGCRAEVRYAWSLGSLAILALAPMAIAWSMLPISTKPAAPRPAAVDVVSSPPFMGTADEIRPASSAGPTPVSFTDPPARESTWRMTPLLAHVVGYLPAIWLTGAPLTFAYLAIGLAGAERLRRSTRLFNPDADIYRGCEDLARVLRMSGSVSLGVCEKVTTPILLGIVRPVILLPPSALSGWSPAHLEMALLHELAHLRRHDNLVNLLQRIVESALFFHPAVWIVSAQVRRDREACCDQVVVRTTGQPRVYAEALLTLHDSSRRARKNVAAAMSEGPLVDRIRLILGVEDPIMRVSIHSLAAVVVTAMILAPAVLVAAAVLAPREEKAEEPKTKTAPPREAPDYSLKIRVVRAEDQSPVDGALVLAQSYRLGIFDRTN